MFARTAGNEQIRELRAKANLARAEIQRLVHGRVDGEPNDILAAKAAEEVMQAARERESEMFAALRIALRRQKLEVPRVTVAGLQEQLGSNHAIVCYRRLELNKLAKDSNSRLAVTPQLVAFVITKQRGLQRFDLGDADEIGELAEQCLKEIERDAVRGLPATSGKQPVDSAGKLTGMILSKVIKFLGQADLGKDKVCCTSAWTTNCNGCRSRLCRIPTAPSFSTSGSRCCSSTRCTA